MRYQQDIVKSVWLNAPAIPGLNEDMWRMAECGQPVEWASFNLSGAEHGWTIREMKIFASAPLVDISATHDVLDIRAQLRV
ncbi:hypothetical protein GJW-30_1_00091 [Variibacter gotjawalensis]|uniref:Uncharacterized protein n=1 Tax=Variibacter gotjawalensis TaxID=1333996 RepID=A0A0S3PNY1_9BRAD|nr:hypothetical protein [Variibacter gotjawalensis]RZS49755.1 hypothetical protein EV661_2198 [Variibacter gotjawalensis]BAT57584.1 hypothetical protein GJW-30_1_00091 [Variibacter gotjawalensis]